MPDPSSALNLILRLTNSDGTTEDIENLDALGAKLQLTSEDKAAIRTSGVALDKVLSARIDPRKIQPDPRVLNKLRAFFNEPDIAGAGEVAAPAGISDP